MSDIPVDIKGRPLAKVQTHLEEKVGLANYSNVTYGGSVTRYVKDADKDIEAAFKENEAQIEGWMKDYYRREVSELVEASAKSKR